MIDKVSFDRIQKAHPALRDDLVSIHNEVDEVVGPYIKLRAAQVLRTWDEQADIYAQGRTKPGKIVTFAKPGDSMHNYGFAEDIVFLIDKDKNGSFEEVSWDFFKDFDKDGKVDFDEVDFIFKKYGFSGLYKADGKRWDFPHFQKTFGLTLADIKRKHLAKDFIPGTSYIKI